MMASHETASVAVFPTNLQTHGGNLMKEASVTLPPPANSVQHLSCPSTSQSPAVKVMEKAYTPQNMSPAKPADVDGTSFINSNKYLKLNVGGSLHYTTMGTLTKEDNMLRAMFSGRMVVLTDSEGWILIDRCGKHFGAILNYLRDGSITLPENRYEIAELLAEAKYYLIQGLVAQCEAMLEKKAVDAEPLCVVPIITSHKEEQELVKKSKRPIIKFMYNRGNNKYSYTNSSDDNMLKNIEVFDKLSLRFNGRILFIKDISGDEICVWSFYGRQRKQAEICCTSIVYATEKKQTKVEFFEARIYEETLNILLCEENVPNSHPVPDINEFFKSGYHCQSDEDSEEKTHRVRRIHVNSNRPPL